MTPFSLIIWKTDTGEIVSSPRYAVSDEFKEAMLLSALAPFGDDYSAMETTAQVDPASHHIHTVRGVPEVAARPAMRILIKNGKTTLVANGVDTVELTGLPNPCTIVQDPGEPEETSYEVTGGGFVFSAETPGKYQFRVDRFPFLPFSVEFTAT